MKDLDIDEAQKIIEDFKLFFSSALTNLERISTLMKNQHLENYQSLVF